LAGQTADGILFSGERIAAGGEYTVRGYRESLILADTGVTGSAELAKSFSLSGRRGTATAVDWGAFSASVFADGAVLRNVEGSQPVPKEIASVGASLSWIPSEAISARVTFARALVDAPIVGTRDLQDRGFHFRITIRPFAM
jgi:hemolysin activation/secretion protein